jgi:hypothetical protein
MRGVVEKALTLVQAFVDEAKVVLLEIAQPPVDHLRGLRRRARGKVRPLDKGGGKTAGGRIEGNAAAGYAGPDDEDVESLRAQALQGLVPVEGASRSRSGRHPVSLPQATNAPAWSAAPQRTSPRAVAAMPRGTFRQ